MKRSLWILTLCGALLAGCAGGSGGKKDNSPDLKQENASNTTPDVWDCGQFVPPNGYEQETAFADANDPDGTQKATDSARNRLIERLCGSGSNCDALSAGSSIWKTGKGGGKVCSMVVIDRVDVDKWRKAATSAANLDKDLVNAAAELLTEKLGGRKKPNVAVHQVIDGGVPGGERAEWLGGRMNRALDKAGAQVREIPRSWNGKGFPRGVDILIEGKTASRTEQQKNIVEVIWKARVFDRSGTILKTAKAVSFPADAAPELTTVVEALPPSDPSLSVRIESGHSGGGLCIGEQTQLWLHSAENLYVRVFDLYGQDGALLLYPNPDKPDGKILAGETIPLGGSGGFEAVPSPGSEVERFLVIAAPSQKALGRFKDYKGYCRVPSHLASQLHKAQGIPKGARAASDGFRLNKGDQCSEGPDAATRKAQFEALMGLPECQ